MINRHFRSAFAGVLSAIACWRQVWAFGELDGPELVEGTSVYFEMKNTQEKYQEDCQRGSEADREHNETLFVRELLHHFFSAACWRKRLHHTATDKG